MYPEQRWLGRENKMAEKEKPKYYAGQVPTQQVPVTAKPDGTPMTQEEVNAEILNKLDQMFQLIKDQL
jgi:hypothetical protein